MRRNNRNDQPASGRLDYAKHAFADRLIAILVHAIFERLGLCVGGLASPRRAVEPVLGIARSRNRLRFIRGRLAFRIQPDLGLARHRPAVFGYFTDGLQSISDGNPFDKKRFGTSGQRSRHKHNKEQFFHRISHPCRNRPCPSGAAAMLLLIPECKSGDYGTTILAPGRSASSPEQGTRHAPYPLSRPRNTRARG